MSLSIFGQVTDIQTSNAVEGATVVIVEPGTTDVLYTTTTSFATAGPGGYFTFDFTPEQMLSLMGGLHHRTIAFKVYDQAVFLGCMDVLISAVTFMGTETFDVKVDSSYSPANSGLLFAVAGRVLEVDGCPIPNIDVKVFENKMASELLLETEQTATDGRFLLRYGGSPHSHPDQALIDITVRAYEGLTLIASTGPICNPRHDLEITLVRDDQKLRGPTSFSAYVASITPQLDTVAFKDLNADQVYYLYCKTGFPEITIATLARSHVLMDAYGIDAEVFYGLAHAGFPLSANSILSLDADTVEAALLRAIEDNAIAASIEQDIPTITAAFAAARLDRAVPLVNPETTTLGAVLTAASLAAGLPRSFADAYLNHTGTISEFWAALRADQNFGDAVVDTIQFTLEAGALAGSHAPLVKLLNQKRDLAVFSVVAELAQYNDQDWIDFLAEQVDGNDVSTPPGIPGANEMERRSNYGRAISRMIEDLYPSAHLAYHLPLGVATADIPDFIVQNPGFSLLSTLVDDFLPTAKGLPPLPEDVERLRQDLLKVQRVVNIVPRYQRTTSASKLLEHGIASARQIRMMGASAFIAQHATDLGGRAVASYIYDKADQVTAKVIAAVSMIRPEMYRPAMDVFTTPGCGDPDLEHIFGSLDYCECRHCDSVYGPAAYFVDIMNFLRAPPLGALQGIDALVARRPELKHIKLNCENAETPLPTIDLVNEVLERAVSLYNNQAPHVVLSTWPQTTWDASDLLAHPEKIYTYVYDNYLSDPNEACFPSALPFDLSLEEARIYLTHLGISRIDLQDAFEWFESGGNESEAYRVDERLGLSPGQATIVRNAGTSLTPWTCWGFSSGAGWISQMNNVELFLERSELSFPQLQELLRTDLLNDSEVLYAEPCRLKGAEIRLIADSQVDGLDEAKLRKLVTIFRVSRSLGWSLSDLDMVLRGLNLSLDAPITTDLDDLSHFLRIRSSFPGLPLGEVIAWWSPLDTRTPKDGVLSFYEEVVRPNTREPEFAIDTIDNNALTLGEVKGSLLAILQIDESNLAAAYAAGGLTSSSALTLANLSILYRIASLAGAVSLSVAELATLVNYSAALKDGNPFAGAPNAPIRELLDLAEQVNGAPFSVSTLDYILRNKSPERFGASHADVTRELLELIVALHAADADFAASLPPDDLPAFDRVSQLLARISDGDDLINSLGLVDKTFPNENATQIEAEAALSALFPFLDSAGAAHLELKKAFGNGLGVEDRANKLVPEVIEHMRRLARSRTVVQVLATQMSLEPADMDAYLGVVGTALDTFTGDAFIGSFDPVKDAEAAKQEIFAKTFLDLPALQEPAAEFQALRKVALIIRGFDFSPGLLRWLLINAPTAPLDILDLSALPLSDQPDSTIYTAYKGWNWLRRTVSIRDGILGNSEDLVPILELIFAQVFDKPSLLGALSISAGWEQSTLTDFEAHVSLQQVGFQEGTAIEALTGAFSAADRVGVDPIPLYDWATEASVSAARAAEIKGVAQAKHSPKVWPSIAEPLRGRLRERQRDALAEYLISRISGVNDREDLLAHFLMDPEVSSCARTSRLLFATSAVQLFVQRALMGFETDVVLDGAEWGWMKRYRVWEANRKIFLYPENWVLPELRDDKTHIFRKLEETLAQGEITADAVEGAYIRYLEDLHEISKLEICGTYHEREVDDNHNYTSDIYHVVARTQGTPSKVYYRQRVNDAYWTSWEEIPFEIGAHDVVPLVINRRLIIAWPRISTRAKDMNKFHGDKQLQKKVAEFKIMWSERHHQGWTKVNESIDSLTSKRTIEGNADTEDRHVFRGCYLTSSLFEGRHYLLLTWSTDPYDANFGREHVGYFVYDNLGGAFIVARDRALTVDKRENMSTHTPFAFRQHYQAYARGDRPNLLSGNYVSELHLPGTDPKTWATWWSVAIIHVGRDAELVFPRQTRVINSFQPFTYGDGDAVLYFRRSDKGMTFGDLGAKDKLSLASAQQASLTPYLGLLGLSQPPVSETTAENEDILAAGADVEEGGTWIPTAPVPRFRVSALYHPHTGFFIEEVRKLGPVGLLAPDEFGKAKDLVAQALDAHIEDIYILSPNHCIDEPLPKADIDFRTGGAYSVYNWELFYHIPMYIADRLMSERKFSEAQKWLHYIFDPTRLPTELENTNCKYYWRIKPFREAAAHVSIEDLLELLHYTGNDAAKIERRDELEAQVDAWRHDPFRPHLVARMRPTAYMRAVVMKYLDNLIAWGDDLFRQDTLESNNEAILYYALALQILGKRPRKIDGDERPDYTLHEALDVNDGFIDDFGNFFVEIENKILGGKSKIEIPLDLKAQDDQQKANPDDYQHGYVTPQGPMLLGVPTPPPSSHPIPMGGFAVKGNLPDTSDPVRTELYFCTPPNAKLMGYWDIVGDRLFKLRNCLNIDGIRRSLPLFQPPIDPALLAKAVAQGIDLSTAIGNLNAPLPHYRFLSHLGVAKDFVAQISGLGNALLSALEKRDAEALAVLRAGQEIGMLASVRRVKESAIAEATENISALEAGRAVVEERLKYYLSRERMNTAEKLELALQVGAIVLDLVGVSMTGIAGIAGAFPDLLVGVVGPIPEASVTTGGGSVSRALELLGRVSSIGAGMARSGAGMASTQASYTRRQEDWQFQARLAERDIVQIDKQITAAEIRKQLAELELDNHDRQAQDSSVVLEYMQSKFTNTELYSWMSGEISKLYFQAYNLAADLARRAERCYRYELGIPDSDVTSFVTFGHWDNRRKGLLAGERLGQDLRRMEAAYYEKNRREYELTKRVSLASLDPVALVALRKTGSCHFFLPETIFDLDHPSHYMRRIKMVGVSIPAVTGPYTSIGATLTYESGAIRRSTKPEEIEAVTSVQTIAISAGQEDTGLFEPNLRDERYLPFEGKGIADSSWRLALPAKVRTFDYETISDVILTIRYTAREGGSVFGDGVQAALPGALSTLVRADAAAEKGVGQVRMFSARGEFPEAWRSFVAEGSGGGAAALELDLSEQRFPQAEVIGSRVIDFMAFFVRFKPDAIATVADLTAPTLNGPAVTDKLLANWSDYKDDMPAGYPDYVWFNAADTLNSAPGVFTLSVSAGWPLDKVPEDIMVLVQYKLA